MKSPLFAAAVLFAASATAAEVQTALPSAEVVLREAATKAETVWVQIHAAEALIAVGQPAPARAAMATVAAQGEPVGVRCGLWRVFAATAASTTERQDYVSKLEGLVIDPASPDRLIAIESLGKLKVIATGPVLQALRDVARTANAADGVLALWSLHLAGDTTAVPEIARRLADPEPLARWRASYALRWIRPASPDVLRSLARAAKEEKPDSTAYPYVISAAYALGADAKQRDNEQRILLQLALTGTPNAQYEACQALLQRGATPALKSQISPVLKSPAGDARIGAAWLMLSSPSDR